MVTRHESYDLTRRNTFGMKVSCRLYVEVTEPEDLLTLDFDALPQPLLMMGGGSNLLFTRNFPGTVLHMANTGRAVMPGSTGHLMVRVGAGVVFDDFCAWAAAEGLWGPENLSLIPGDVGASAVQNIGAYGVEAKDIIDTVHAFDLKDRAFVDIPAADCAYGYRASLFKTDWKGRYIITAVTFRLSTVPQPKLDYGGGLEALLDRFTPSSLTPTMIRETVIAIREQKLPDPKVVGSAGSFFCNPVIERDHFARIVAIAKEENGPNYKVKHYDVGDRVKVPAAWMIDQCGLKGARVGGAQVYPKQPLVIVNATGDATPEDIITLERRVIDAVREKYGIELHPEVEHISLMARFKITGGRTLSGEITPQGAKNEALQVICATLLTDEPVTITNVPDIQDVQTLIKVMELMGVDHQNPEKGTHCFRADKVDTSIIETDEFITKCSKLRGSVMVVGPLLTRFGHALFPKPGGDKIGRRRVDTHLDGLIKLGAKWNKEEERRSAYPLTSKGRLKGCYMVLDEASVTGTANIVMAAVLAKGKTTIYNAACEPYLQQLCKMLNRMGAHIEGVGSNMLTIYGVEKLHGTEHRLLPDMIEVGSFIGMAAITRSAITIKGAHKKDLGIIPDAFDRLGVKTVQRGDDLFVPAKKHYVIKSFKDGSIMTLADAPWPGLTPDLLSVLLVVATQCRGSVLIHQKMFESRLFFVDRLIDMGAQIILCDPHRAVVIGHDHRITLRASHMVSPDIRAGIAMLLAAMSAKGDSFIDNIDQIDRGYEDIESRLNALGANVERIFELKEK